MRARFKIRGATPEFMKFPYRLLRNLTRDVFFIFLTI